VTKSKKGNKNKDSRTRRRERRRQERVLRKGEKVINKTFKFAFYSDVGHGWLRVPLDMLRELGILEQITHYSYKKDNHVFLEEDLDAHTFYNAFVEKYGYEPEIKNQHNETSFVRGLESFKVAVVQ
jgi:hypothetical protein